MRWAIIGLIVVGVVAALSAAVLAAALRARPSAPSTTEEPELTNVEVLVAMHDLGAMSVIDASAVARKTVSFTEVPQGALTNPIQIIGRILNVPIVRGEPFTTTKIAREGDRVHLASALPEGRRAMVVPLAGDAGVEGLLYPGALVDVVASFRVAAEGRAAGDVVSATLLQAVQVLAVGRESVISRDKEEKTSLIGGRGGGSGRPRVTLLVNSRQAEALQLAMQHGALTLVLRNPLDKGVASAEGLLLSELSAEIAPHLFALIDTDELPEPINLPLASDGLTSPQDEVEASAPAEWTVFVHRGQKRETQTFPIDEAFVTTSSSMSQPR